MTDAGTKDVDATTPTAPDIDRVPDTGRTAWKQMMQVREERMTARARKEARPLEYNPIQR